MATSARARRIALTLVFVMLLILLGVTMVHTLPTAVPKALKAPTATIGLASHPRYTFVAQFPPAFAQPQAVQQGDIYTVVWQPQVDTDHLVTGPTPVKCSLLFYGPYSTFATAKLAQSAVTNGGNPLASPTASASSPVALAPLPLIFDDLTSTPQSDAVRIPPEFASGYYVVVARELDAYSGLTLGLILQVTPRP